jgi:hypothetical protein
MLLILVSLRGLISCVSQHKHLLVYLSCHSITKTKQRPFMRQQPGETLRAFISRFTKVRGTIPRIFDASIITAFRQGVRDKKMLEKLATQQVETVTTLFALANKCARAAEGRAWHSALQAGPAQMSGPNVAASGSGKKKNKKKRGFDKS